MKHSRISSTCQYHDLYEIAQQNQNQNFELLTRLWMV